MDRGDVQRVAERLLIDDALDPSDRMELAVAFLGWVDGTFASLDEALGLKRTRGQRSNKQRALQAERQALLQQCAAQFYSTSKNVPADVDRDASRYAAAGWLRDKHKPEMPLAYAGTARAFFFKIFQRGGPLPRSQKQIRRMLGRQPHESAVRSGVEMSRQIATLRSGAQHQIDRSV